MLADRSSHVFMHIWLAPCACLHAMDSFDSTGRHGASELVNDISVDR